MYTNRCFAIPDTKMLLANLLKAKVMMHKLMNKHSTPRLEEMEY